jgi:hypothetical protein
MVCQSCFENNQNDKMIKIRLKDDLNNIFLYSGMVGQYAV